MFSYLFFSARVIYIKSSYTNKFLFFLQFLLVEQEGKWLSAQGIESTGRFQITTEAVYV